MAQDTTNFTKISCNDLSVYGPIASSGNISAAGILGGDSAVIIGNVAAGEINGRADSVVVIPTMASGAVTLSAAQKKATVVEVTVGHATNILLLGLVVGQSVIVRNNSNSAVVIVKNIAGDIGYSLAAEKTVLCVAGTGGTLITLLTA
jgi:hypothetical protein